jgi:hypothetical protein
VICLKILYGIANGSVLQRNSDGVCVCKFAAECSGELRTSLGRLINIGNEYILTGIPTGGPYDLELMDDCEAIKLQIWVGDIWVLGGQSNMEGAGCMTESDFLDEVHPNPALRAYYLDNRWDGAKPILHEPWISVDACQRELWKRNQLNSIWKSDQPPFISHGVPKRGVGPGLYFAKKLYSITGVPQAVIPCALGGASLEDWKPESVDGSGLYGAMLRRFKRVGSKVRGLFWYQGCSETSQDGVKNFTEKMVNFISAVRRDFGDADLPFVQVQIAQMALPWSNDFTCGLMWEGIREKQRTLGDIVPNMDTVAAIDAPRDDLIHLSSEGEKIVGERAALSMAKLCSYPGGIAAPKLSGMSIHTDEYRPFWAVLALHYDNVSKIVSTGAPSGFTITKTPDEQMLNPSCRIARIILKNDTVLLYTEMTENELRNHYVRYGYLNMGYCNIGDVSGHLLPAMGPIAISEYIK